MWILLAVLAWYSAIIVVVAIVLSPLYVDGPLTATQVIVGSILSLPIIALALLTLRYLRQTRT